MLIAVGLGFGAPARADDATQLKTRIAALETQTAALGTTVSGLEAQSGLVPLPPANVGAAPVNDIQVAQSNSADLGALNVRVGQLEEQVRSLTGQVQGLQFQLAQMQTLIQNMQADTDARLTALEGGSPKKTKATSQSGGAMPSGGKSQPQSGQSPESQPGSGQPAVTDLPKPLDLTAPDTPSSDNGSSSADSDTITLGTPPHALGTLSLDGLGASAAPDITEDTGQIVTAADAEAQYKAGYDAVVRGDYAFAEDQFRQFIGLFPDNPHAPDATDWLGEALLQRKEYDDAAEILLNGFETYPHSARAPDMLLKLGIALNGTGETDTACRTFAEISKRFPNQPAAFTRRVAQEQKKAGCP